MGDPDPHSPQAVVSPPAPAADAPATDRLRARPSRELAGEVAAPGDKSISHRALILGALARGETQIEGLLEGEDVLSTAAAVKAFGAEVERLGPGRWRVTGEGGFQAPQGMIDCGNAGTGARLLMGAAAGFALQARFDGDASLRSRPMGRVTAPLKMMGARFETAQGERLPLTLTGGGLEGLSYTLPVPSAQVKSAILLAGLNARGLTEVVEPEPTRDHTERMLRGFGAEISVADEARGRVIRLKPSALTGQALRVPGDPSSAAFPLVAALVTEGSAVTVRDVLLNPLRTGLYATLKEMGADLEIAEAPAGAGGGERMGAVTARSGPLKGVVVAPERAPSMIDEYPILAVAAAFAEGVTVMRGIGELRVKESDRIALMARALTACGVEVEEEPDGLIVLGLGAGARPRGGAEVVTHGDHRVAMSALVLGLGAQAPVTVDAAGMIATSFPGFTRLMAGLGADIGPA